MNQNSSLTVREMLEYIRQHPNQSELEIARGVGLKKTPYTRNILLWLWNEGKIIRWMDEAHLPRPAFVYYIQETEPLP